MITTQSRHSDPGNYGVYAHRSVRAVAMVFFSLALGHTPSVRAQADCNSNGSIDDLDIAAGTSRDCDTNGVPDECEPVVWLEHARLTDETGLSFRLGTRLAISGNTAIVGAPTNELDLGWGAGSAYIFFRTGGVWALQTQLSVDGGNSAHAFGSAVAIDGNTAIVGSYLENASVGAHTGAAYVFVRSGGVWTQQARLTANDAAADDTFGYSVAISGDAAVIGAPWDRSPSEEGLGSVYIFRRTGAAWSQVAQLRAPDGKALDRFGIDLAMEGDTIIVGMDPLPPPERGGGFDPTSAYVFVRSGPPGAESWPMQAQLFAEGGGSLGFSVDVSGDTAMAGGYIFVRSGAVWTQQAALGGGTSVAIWGDTAVVGAPGNDHDGGVDAGAAYLFHRNAGAWTLLDLVVATDASAGDQFGNAVALEGRTLLVGAYHADPYGQPDAGAAYVLTLDADCNGNGVRDTCDVAGGTSEDCDINRLSDECEFVDCNSNGLLDTCDVLQGANDCDGDGVPDECELAGHDCDDDGTPDDCAIADCPPEVPGCADCNANGVPDGCELADNDCNTNSIPDDCDIASDDCNVNTIPDDCDIAGGTSADADANEVPDSCEDCNGNGAIDNGDIAGGTSFDCNADGVPDDCTLASGLTVDCNGNLILDVCEISAGTSADCNWNAVPDECDYLNGLLHDAESDGAADECTVDPRYVADAGQKGSILFFPLVELRWDESGNLIQDVFIQLTNDFPQQIHLRVFFVQGDPPLPTDSSGHERAHPGFNRVNHHLFLTQNQPLLWSAFTGASGLPPFSVLDPGSPPGRPDPYAPGERVLRGYLVAWAVNDNGHQIRWNHLWGDATIVRYDQPASSTYTATPFQCLRAFGLNGARCGEFLGELLLNGKQYDAPPSELIFNFYAVGARISDTGGDVFSVDMGITLAPAVMHFLDDPGAPSLKPVQSTADLDVWNANAVKLTGAARCVTGWDRSLLSALATPNHFLVENLQTDNGAARIEGGTSAACPGSRSAPLLGILTAQTGAPGGLDNSSRTLVGRGAEFGVIRTDDEPVSVQNNFFPGTERAHTSRAGSLLVYPHVEVAWDAAGNVVQDTYIDLTNIADHDVHVRMLFAQGDPPADAQYGGEPPELLERAHAGWNSTSTQFDLAAHQPAYWSAASGLPAGLPPWSTLDPGTPSGRPRPDGATDRMLRGYLLVWAVNEYGQEIRWNHLIGGATQVNQETGAAWNYDAYSFEALAQGGVVPEGAQTGTPLALNLNGVEYGNSFDLLVLNILASGSTALSGPGQDVVVDSQLSLVPMSIDYRNPAGAPVTTRQVCTVWNENETKFTGTARCMTGWDATLLSQYAEPNAYLLNQLQTDAGKAQIDGLASSQCNTAQVVSSATSLLGVYARRLHFQAGADRTAGAPAVGAGTQTALIRYGPDCNANAIPDDIDIAHGSSPDCNINAIPDSCDIAAGTSADVNANGTPDQCDAWGDWDGDGDVDLADFAGAPACSSGPWQRLAFVVPSPACRTAFDADADGDVDLADFAAFQAAINP